MRAPPAAWVDQDEEVEQAVTDSYVGYPSGRDVLVTMMAGGVSGALAKSAVAPLARLTILYQVRALQPVGGGAAMPGLLAALRQVVQQEGVASLWKGNLATMLHRVPYSAVNFATFEYVKQLLEPHTASDLTCRLAAGAASGVAACTVAYPLDLVRTRLSAQRDMLPRVTRLTRGAGLHLGLSPDLTFPTPARAGLPPALRAPRHYRSIRHAFGCILRDEGPAGLYRGLAATLAQVTPTLALNFAFYDSFKAAYIKRRAAAAAAQQLEPGGTVAQLGEPPSLPQPQAMGLLGSLSCGAASGFASSTLTFPLDVVRKRMQTVHAAVQPRYGDVVRQLLAEQGWRGFYAGIVPEYAKVLPGMAIAFAVYEGIKGALGVGSPA